MKRQIQRWMLRLTVTGVFIAGLLLVIILNPVLTYANKTTHNNCTIYHNQTLDPLLLVKLDQAAAVLKTSELYSNDLKLDICLHDGSHYPEMISTFYGQAFARGFYNKVVIQGKMNCKDNFVEVNGYKWNLTQLLAHEMTHCLQFDKLGLWKSKPFANIPNWKWEGYAEYVSRQDIDQKDLSNNIIRFATTNKNDWAIRFSDSTVAPREYYSYWLLVQYCMIVKKMSFIRILADTTSEQEVRQDMMRWFNKSK